MSRELILSLARARVPRAEAHRPRMDGAVGRSCAPAWARSSECRTLPPMTNGPDRERDLGEQPLAGLMAERGLKPADLVAASGEQLTHKMVARALRGRRLTANTMGKVQRAWNLAAQSEHAATELFNYEP